MRAYVFRVGLFAATGLVMSSAPLAAQQWRVSAQAGRIHSALDPAPSESFTLGVQYDDPTADLRLTGGVPMRSGDPLRGGASAWKRLAMHDRGFVAGLDLAGNAFRAVDRSAQPAAPLPFPFDQPT